MDKEHLLSVRLPEYSFTIRENSKALHFLKDLASLSGEKCKFVKQIVNISGINQDIFAMGTRNCETLLGPEAKQTIT